MSMKLIFFYGVIITSVTTYGVSVYVKAMYQESKTQRINHSNFGSD